MRSTLRNCSRTIELYVDTQLCNGPCGLTKFTFFITTPNSPYTYNSICAMKHPLLWSWHIMKGFSLKEIWIISVDICSNWFTKLSFLNQRFVKAIELYQSRFLTRIKRLLNLQWILKWCWLTSYIILLAKRGKIYLIEIQINFELSHNAFMYHVGFFSFQTVHKFFSFYTKRIMYG